MENYFTIGVFGIIFDKQNRVLLCHRRDYDLWNLPGGGLKSEEFILDGVKREVEEETGLEVEIFKLIGVYDKPQEKDIALSFTCKVVGGKITLNDEADKIEYFDINNLPHNTSPKQVERIKDAFQNLKNVIIKKQIGKCSINLVKDGEL
ncbi:MAG: NUDIX domain-containing protein [Patescibacteria group bacterium]